MFTHLTIFTLTVIWSFVFGHWTGHKWCFAFSWRHITHYKWISHALVIHVGISSQRLMTYFAPSLVGTCNPAGSVQYVSQPTDVRKKRKFCLSSSNNIYLRLQYTACHALILWWIRCCVGLSFFENLFENLSKSAVSCVWLVAACCHFQTAGLLWVSASCGGSRLRPLQASLLEPVSRHPLRMLQ